MPNCTECGVSIPINQGSKTCSMCYGDIDHGKDGYYRSWAEGVPDYYEFDYDDYVSDDDNS